MMLRINRLFISQSFLASRSSYTRRARPSVIVHLGRRYGSLKSIATHISLLISKLNQAGAGNTAFRYRSYGALSPILPPAHEYIFQALYDVLCRYQNGFRSSPRSCCLDICDKHGGSYGLLGGSLVLAYHPCLWVLSLMEQRR